MVSESVATNSSGASWAEVPGRSVPEGNRPSEKPCGVPAPGNFVTDASKGQSGVLEDRDHKLQTPLNTLEVDHTAHVQHLSGLNCGIWVCASAKMTGLPSKMIMITSMIMES